LEQKESIRIILQMNNPFIFSTRISTSLTSVRVRFLTIRLLIVGLLVDEAGIEQADMLIIERHMRSVENKCVGVIMCFMVYVFPVSAIRTVFSCL